MSKTAPLQQEKKSHTLKALVCSSWGYENAFAQYADVVKAKFPNDNITIKCETYPIAGAKNILNKIASFILALGVLSGIASMINPQLVNVYQAQLGLPNGVFMGLLLGAFVVQKMTGSSGAFELFVDDKIIHSKLESGKMPSKQAVVDAVGKAIA